MKYKNISYKTLLGTFADAAVFLVTLTGIACVAIGCCVFVVKWFGFVWNSLEF